LKKLLLSTFIGLLFSLPLLAVNCSSFKTFQTYNGHFYSTTVDRVKYDDAKTAAENDNGYLAIPNNAGENNFIKGLIGGNTGAWIGVYDPNKISNYCYENSGTICFNDDSRFKDVKNTLLGYKNWDTNEPNNLVRENDILNGISMVSPIGEFWVLMNGNNGKWRDTGNHAESENPIKMISVVEFDEQPTCYKANDNVSELPEKFCNTQTYDGNANTLQQSNTLECIKDTYGTYYCPSGLANADSFWDYDAGYSVANVGTASDFTQKICDGNIINGVCYDRSVTDATKITNLSCVTKSVPCAPGASSCCHIDIACASDSATVKYYDCCSPTGGLKKSVTINDANAFINGVYYQPYTNSQGRMICNSSGACSVYFQNAYCGGAAIGSPYLTNTFSLNTSDTYICNDNAYVVGSLITADPTKCYKQKALSCPSTHPEVQPDGTCKSNVNYTYYTYLCTTDINDHGNTYVPSSVGGDCTSVKTDPNVSTSNISTLDDTCNSSIPPTDNCARLNFTCNSTVRDPVWVDNKWQCSPFPCLGDNDVEDLRSEFGTQDANNDGWDEGGGCSGDIYVFNGSSQACTNWDMFASLASGGCCSSENIYGGLVDCSANEKNLIELKDADQCHYVGEFCSNEVSLPFGGSFCSRKDKGYCCFNSVLARILIEQGRAQLGISWGQAKNPYCKGFKPEEFQKLDMSQMDLSEFTNSLDVPDISTIGASLKTRVESQLNTAFPQSVPSP
jgi:conjugal transfer mating pair stabilization protein TraN